MSTAARIVSQTVPAVGEENRNGPKDMRKNENAFVKPKSNHAFGLSLALVIVYIIV